MYDDNVKDVSLESLSITAVEFAEVVGNLQDEGYIKDAKIWRGGKTKYLMAAIDNASLTDKGASYVKENHTDL